MIKQAASYHALERLSERYAVAGSQDIVAISHNIRTGRNSLKMDSDKPGSSRVVCYYHKQWFLLVYDWIDDIIITFLPPYRSALRDEEKKMLCASEVYNRIADDAFGVLNSTPISRRVYGQESDNKWGVKLFVPPLDRTQQA